MVLGNVVFEARAPNSREASIGMRVRATMSDTDSENVTVMAWSPKSWPATPSTKTIGTKTQTVVIVLAITACPTSPAPERAASTTLEAVFSFSLDGLEHDDRVVDEKADPERDATQ